MKILILGASGMVGSAFYRVLQQTNHDIWVGLRKRKNDYGEYFAKAQALEGLQAENYKSFEEQIDKLKPQIVINAMGVTLRKAEIQDLDFTLMVNSLLPQKLRIWCQRNQAHLIQMSTDCVFSGKTDGDYTELSTPDATDVYGRTKALGEVDGSHCLTIRGSMIGPEWFGKTELFEWALAKKGQKVSGYDGVIYSGITTLAMAQFITKLIQAGPLPVGLFQVSGAPISKYDLLCKINQVFGLEMQIEKNTSQRSRKLLLSHKSQKELGFLVPEWDKMLEELAHGL